MWQFCVRAPTCPAKKFSTVQTQASQAQDSTLHAWCIGKLVYIENCMGKSPIVKLNSVNNYLIWNKVLLLQTCCVMLIFVLILKPFWRSLVKLFEIGLSLILNEAEWTSKVMFMWKVSYICYIGQQLRYELIVEVLNKGLEIISTPCWRIKKAFWHWWMSAKFYWATMFWTSLGLSPVTRLRFAM